MAQDEKLVFSRPHSLLPVVTNYCPGCTHGIVHRLVCETMDELDIEGQTIGVGARRLLGHVLRFLRLRHD